MPDKYGVPTYKENPKMWEEMADKHQNAWQIIKYMMEKGCYYSKCSYKTSNFESMAFHIHSTHGFPREMFIDTLKEMI